MIQNPTGVLLRADLTLELLREGHGVAIALRPDEARSLAAELLRLADEHEAADTAALLAAEPVQAVLH